MSDPDIGAKILHQLKVLRIATIVLGVAFLLIVLYVYVDSGNKRDALKQESDRTENALCSLRNNLKDRNTDSKNFLKKHPRGIKDISKEDIQRDIRNTGRTLNALSIIKCPLPPPAKHHRPKRAK